MVLVTVLQASIVVCKIHKHVLSSAAQQDAPRNSMQDTWHSTERACTRVSEFYSMFYHMLASLLLMVGFQLLCGTCKKSPDHVQVTDTPGLLNRAEADRNAMERLTIACMAHLPTSILFVLDLTGA